MEQESKKAKRFNLIAFAIVCAFVLAVAGLFYWLCNLPASEMLETQRLEANVQQPKLNVLLEDTCYELDGGEALADLCSFESWEVTDRPEPGEHILTIRLAELYEIAFYENGVAQAYDGYSPTLQLSNLWYQVPEDAAAALADYVRGNGTVREVTLGAASLFRIDE